LPVGFSLHLMEHVNGKIEALFFLIAFHAALLSLWVALPHVARGGAPSTPIYEEVSTFPNNRPESFPDDPRLKPIKWGCCLDLFRIGDEI